MIADHSFVILAYKESPHLQECIDSLKNQNVESEIIICTSTPSVFLDNIAKNNNLNLLINPNRSDIANDWNFALKNSTTKYVTLTHQDDIYFPKYTEQIITVANTKKDSIIVFTNYDEIVHNSHTSFIRKSSINFFIKQLLLKLFFRNKNYITQNKSNLLEFGNPIGCPTITFNKSNIGNFLFDNEFSINMDWKAWHDLSRREGSFLWIKKTLMSHRIYPESETSVGLSEHRRQDEDYKLFKLMWPKFIAFILSRVYGLSYINNKI